MPEPESNRAWPALPTETEIYILPNGEIVVADLPSELAEVLAAHLNHELTTASDEVFAAATSVDTTHVADQQHPT
jgi:hypothetical protein